MRSDGNDSDDARRLDRALPALTLVAMAAALIALTVLIGPVDVSRPDWLKSEGGGGGPTNPSVTLTWGADMQTFPEPADPTPSTLNIPFTEIFLVIAIIVAVWIALLLYRRIRWARRPDASRITGGEVEFDETADDLRKAAEEAGDALHRGNMPSADAIIHAWLTLERAAAGTGAARIPTQTPSEFTATLLRHHQADADAVGRLLDLYEQARFSTRPEMSSDDVTDAKRALQAIMHTLSTKDAEKRA